MKKILTNLKRHLLTGTSHMIPFIVAGGILFSISVMLNPDGATAPSGDSNTFLYGLSQKMCIRDSSKRCTYKRCSS